MYMICSDCCSCGELCVLDRRHRGNSPCMCDVLGCKDMELKRAIVDMGAAVRTAIKQFVGMPVVEEHSSERLHPKDAVTASMIKDAVSTALLPWEHFIVKELRIPGMDVVVTRQPDDGRGARFDVRIESIGHFNKEDN